MFNSYHTTAILIVLVCFYLVSLFLVKKQIISWIFHKKIWNLLLAISFLVSGMLGVLLAFLVDNKAIIEGYRTLLWWHVEFGVAMAIVAIFHLFWHIKYFFMLGKR